jgi:outer membrane protein TolC
MSKRRSWAFASTVVLILMGSGAYAQGKYEFSAKQAVDYAVGHVTELKNLKIDRQIQDAMNKELTGQAYPQVNGSLSAQHYFSTPVTLLPDFITPQVYGVLQKEGVKDGGGNPINVPSGPPNSFPVSFGVPWQASAGFTFQQLLFQPDVFVGLQARGKALELSDWNIKSMEDSVRSNVYRAYYSVLIAEKRMQFLDSSLLRLEKLRSDQGELFKNGFAEKLDIDKTQVSLNNLQTTRVQLANLVYLGYASLKYSTGLNQKDTLVLSDTLSLELVKKDILEASTFKYDDRNEVRQLKTVTELLDMQLRRQKLGYFPTVAAFWNYSDNALRQKFNFFDFSKPWYKTSFVGLNINVPIFDGGQRHFRIKQARLDLEKSANNLQNLERAIDFQREASVAVFKNSLSSLDVQVRNYSLAERVYNTTKKKYEQGLGSSFEVLQADSEFQQAQSNYFQALYDAINAKIGYYRSLGKL